MSTNKNIKRLPIEWQAIDEIVVIDADGWRCDNKSWDDPITRFEWDKRKSQSTIRPKKKIKGMTVRRGDTIESEFGRGLIVAITKQWVIHEIRGGEEEVALYRARDSFWIPAEPVGEDVLDVEMEID